MKRIYIGVTFFLLVFLSGCAKLPQDYFTNTTRDSIDDALVLLKGYKDDLQEYYTETYPNEFVYSDISGIDGYETVNPSKAEYDRDEFVNYNLTDHRRHGQFSHLSVVLTQIDEVITLAEKCDKLKEGVFCASDEEDGASIMFQMEEKQLVFVYNVDIERRTYRTVFEYHFQMEDEKVVLTHHYDMKSKSTDGIIEELDLEYKEDNYENSTLYQKLPNATTYMYKHDIQNEKFYNIIKTSQFYTLSYITTDEYFAITTQNNSKDTYIEDDFELFTYEKYNGNKKVFGYDGDNNEFFVNLSEISGWNRIVRTTNGTTFVLYSDMSVIENLSAMVEFDKGEYAYTRTVNPFNIGLNIPFTVTIINEKEEFITENFISIIDESGFGRPGLD